MKKGNAFILVIALLIGCGQTAQSTAEEQTVDIWTAAATGNLEAIKQHVSAGTDLNAKEPAGGSTPLMVAALFDQAEAAELLIEKGANINVRNNDGGTALHNAAFFCRTRTVKLLLSKDADVNAKNSREETPLDIVAGKWSQDLEGIYKWIAELLQLQLDIERIKATRPKIAALLRKHSERVASAPSIDIWTAAAQGNLEAIKQHVAAGTDLNAKEPSRGSTPLIVATVFGQTEAARLLIEKGANVNVKNNDETTALLTAAFFCHTETVNLLLKKGAKVNAINNNGQTPLDTVAGEWNEEVEGIYKYFEGILQIQLDIERIKATRPKIAALLRKSGGKTGSELKATSVTTFRGSYFVNGEIHVNTYGTPEGKPLTTGHQDFKPSWSKTGNMLVFFRRLKNHPVTVMWKTAICVINVDGTGFHKLTDGTHTDFNQTWTRDGTNTPIWNRKNPETGSFYVMKSKVGAKPGQEVALTDKNHHTWAYTCLKDGRILVQSAHPKQGWGYYLMTPNPDGEPRFERIECELATKGLLDRVSVSPSETRVCFEYQKGFQYKDAGRTLYMADFDAAKPAITKAKPFANEEGANRWFAYPRWTKDETAIVYHASPSLYLYTLKDGSTRKVSTNDSADYRYPHCEAVPK
jgi:ankyrin repeat protein